MASNPLLKFKEEILKGIVLPKLKGLLHEDKGNLSINELWKLFREKYDCTVSFREFKEWCEELQLKPQQTTVWNLPERKPIETKQHSFTGQGGLNQYIPTNEDLDEVLFDNE